MSQTQSRAPILLLDPEATQSKGISHLIYNIDSLQALSDSIATTFGPFGRDKLIIKDKDFVVSNDGAFILSSLKISHPIADLIRDVSITQDNVIGDGTTSVCLLTVNLLKNLKRLILKKMDIKFIIKTLLEIEKKSLDFIENYEKTFGISSTKLDLIKGFDHFYHEKEEKISFDKEMKCDEDLDTDNLLVKRFRNNYTRLDEKSKTLLNIAFDCSRTALASKVLNRNSEFFSTLLLSALYSYSDKEIKKSVNHINYCLEPGGSISDSFLFEGVCFKKPFSYAGFERSPKLILNKKIALLDVELELNSEKDNMEIRINTSEEYSKVVEAEYKIFREKMDLILDAFGNDNGVIFSSMPIGDFATQYFSEKGVYCAGRVDMKILKKLETITGGRVIANLNYFMKNDNEKNEGIENSLGDLFKFEERRIGNNRYCFISTSPKVSFSCDKNIKNEMTVVLRGGSKKYLEEAQRSLNDAAKISSVVLISSGKVVIGAGAFEIQLSDYLRQKSIEDINSSTEKSTAMKKEVYECYAEALEFLPEQLANNAGYDGLEIIGLMKEKNKNNELYGIDLDSGKCYKEVKAVEPKESKINIVRNSIEAVCLTLKITETIKDRPTQKVD